MPLVLTGDGAVGPLSATEVGYLDGVTSGVQAQINTKANDASLGLYFIASQVFSASTAVNVNNCFTSTYDVYRVTISLIGSANVDVSMRLRVSGSDYTSTGHYYGITGLTSGGAAVNKLGNNTTAFFLNTPWTGYYGQISVDVYAPNLARATGINLQSMGVSSGADASWAGSGTLATTTQYDGFSIYPASGSITGTLRIYGYRNS